MEQHAAMIRIAEVIICLASGTLPLPRDPPTRGNGIAEGCWKVKHQKTNAMLDVNGCLFLNSKQPSYESDTFGAPFISTQDQDTCNGQADKGLRSRNTSLLKGIHDSTTSRSVYSLITKSIERKLSTAVVLTA